MEFDGNVSRYKAVRLVTVISVWIDVFKLTAKYPGCAWTVPLILRDALSVLENKQLLMSSPRQPVCGKIGKLPSDGDCE